MKRKKINMKKYGVKKSYIYSVLLGILGFIIVLTFTIIVVGWLKKQNYIKKNQSQSVFIAPNYGIDSFKTPKDVLLKNKTATDSARIPIIMYHYIEYVKDPGDTIRKQLDIVPDLFEGQLKSLNDANYITYFVKDIPAILNKSIVAAPKSIILTFDDGYEDFYTNAFPILKKYQMKATIYIIIDFINKKGFLTDKEIKEIIDSGLVEIGSHTLDHVYLKTVSKAVAEKQIVESKRILEHRFKIPIETFAYPVGAFNQETIDIVKNAGYSAAVSVIPGISQSEVNLYYLNRIRPGVFTPKTIIRILENYKK